MRIICCNKLIVTTLIGPINREPQTLKNSNFEKPISNSSSSFTESFNHLLRNPKSQPASEMSEQQSLIPNLNEIMEEYVGNEEEVTPELQIMVMKEERKETEQPVEESRKRKRNTKDAEP